MTAERLKAAESINVTWNEVPFGHVNGLLMGYSIKYRRVKTAEKNVVHLEETAIAKSTDLWIVLNVQTYSVYKIEVAAFGLIPSLTCHVNIERSIILKHRVGLGGGRFWRIT